MIFNLIDWPDWINLSTKKQHEEYLRMEQQLTEMKDEIEEHIAQRKHLIEVADELEAENKKLIEELEDERL